MVNGLSQVLDRVRAYKFGKMVANTRDIGWLIRPMDLAE